ncbi:unnamed protein product [Boreogadus saida]
MGIDSARRTADARTERGRRYKTGRARLSRKSVKRIEGQQRAKSIQLVGSSTTTSMAISFILERERTPPHLGVTPTAAPCPNHVERLMSLRPSTAP